MVAQKAMAIPVVEALPCYEKQSTGDMDLEEKSTRRDEASSSTRPETRKNTSFIGRLFGTFSGSRQAARNTVMANIRRMMQDTHATSMDWTNLLKSCDAICSEASLSLSCVLQEHFIEDHTPLYWAIINQDEGDPIKDPDLFTMLMNIATPLTEPTISDIHHACIVTSDQALFHRLRYMPGFSPPMSGADELLLSRTVGRDQVKVEDIPDVNGRFVAEFEIAQFRKRMRVTKEIVIEFIARGRMWRLTLFVSTKEVGKRPRGSWCMSLCLLNHSPPTFIEGKFVIDAVNPRAQTSTHHTESTLSTHNSSTSTSSIVVPCQSFQQLFPTTSSKHNALITALEDSPIGSTVQHKGTTFIAPDETLRLSLHARLCKPPPKTYH